MKMFSKKKVIFSLGIIVGILISLISVTFASDYINFASADVGYHNELTEETSVQGAIDDIYDTLVEAGIIYNCTNVSTSSVGDVVDYAGVKWNVISTDDDSVTLILNENLSISPFDTGGSTTFGGSSSYYLLNTEYVLANKDLKAAIEHECLLSVGTYNSNDYFIRLPEASELSTSAVNASNTGFLTQTVSGTGIRFGNPDGTAGTVYSVSNQTWYRGYSKNPSDGSSSDPLSSTTIASRLTSGTAIAPTATSVNYSYNKYNAGQYGSLSSAPYNSTFCYCTGSGSTNCDGWTSSGWQVSTGCGTVYRYTLNSTSIGLRPVIEVAK